MRAVSGEGDRGQRNLLRQGNKTRKEMVLGRSLLRGVQRGGVKKQLLAVMGVLKRFEVKTPGERLASQSALLPDWSLQDRGQTKRKCGSSLF